MSMRSAVSVWLSFVVCGCSGGVRLEGEGEDAPDATRPEIAVDVPPPPPPPESPAWCPADAAAVPCGLAERTRVRLEGSVAAVGFVDDGAYLLVAWSPAGTSGRGSRIELVHVGLAGEVERTEVGVRAEGLVAAWTGDGFAAFVGESSEGDALWVRVGLDGTATTAPTDARICEELVALGAEYACLTATTRDLLWLRLGEDGLARETIAYTVDGFLRSAAWSAVGSGLLYTAVDDLSSGMMFLRVDASGAAAAGPRLVSSADLADMLLAPAPRGHLGLAAVHSIGVSVSSPTGRRWDSVRLALLFIEPDGSMVYRPVEVGRFQTNGHVPSWGPTHFAVAGGEDDAVTAWRHVDVRRDDPVTPERALLRFAAATPEGELGEVVELEPTTDDDFLVERIVVGRAGTGLAVARSHSRPGDVPLALDLWLGCCE